MSRIFISYRREDSADIAGRISDHLLDRFGQGEVFLDVVAIDAGEDFVNVLNRSVASCDVLLAIIGSRWLTAANHDGTRRLEDPNDYVRTEILAAFRSNTPLIPVLVHEAVLPNADKLPQELTPLVRRNATSIRHASFRQDMQKLIADIEKQLDLRRVERPMLAAPNISKIDRALEMLLKLELPPSIGEVACVTFVRPDEEFPPPSVALPAIDLFLYDIEQRPTRVDHHYLITAWASFGSPFPAQDEHHLLSMVSAVLNRHTLIARPLETTAEKPRRGRRSKKPEPEAETLLPLRIRPTQPENLSEIWQTLGVRRRMAFTYMVSVDLRPEPQN